MLPDRGQCQGGRGNAVLHRTRSLVHVADHRRQIGFEKVDRLANRFEIVLASAVSRGIRHDGRNRLLQREFLGATASALAKAHAAPGLSAEILGARPLSNQILG